MSSDGFFMFIITMTGVMLTVYTALVVLTPKYKIHLCLLISFPFWVGFNLLRVYFIDSAPERFELSALLILNMIASFILFYLFIHFICREGILKKLLIALLIYSITMLAEFIAYSIFAIALGESFELLYDNNVSIFGPLVTLLIQSLFFIIFIIFWKRNEIESRTDLTVFGLFLFMPLSYVFLLVGITIIALQYGYTFSAIVFIGAIIGFFANLVILRILFSNIEKTKLKSRLAELEYIYELERERYESVEVRQYEFAKIRHDFNNQLTTAYRLMEQNRQDEAAGILKALEAEIKVVNEKVYCSNSVVNAVLTEKQAICEDIGIVIDINVSLDDDCDIKPLHLCSVFSNLLDNAINACRDIPGSIITLNTLKKGDYLHIKCVNPLPQNSSSKPKSGYGTRILADIANRYEGSCNIGRTGETYSAVISLMCTAG